MKLKSTTIDLTVRLKEDEIARHGERLAALEIELGTMRQSKRETVKALNETIEQQEAAILALAETIRTGEEIRPTHVKIIPDPVTYRMTFVDPDTGEVLFSREMTEAERQGDLPMGDE